MTDRTERSWQGRPAWAAAIRGIAFVVPIVAAVGAALLVAHLLPRPRTVLPLLAWYLTSFAVSALTVVLVGREARRLLPLAALLKLSMAFPDKAPSRFSMALRTGTVGALKARIEDVRENGIDPDAGNAAETILMLAAALNAHDPGTRGHAERVRALTEMVGEELGLPVEDLEKLRWSSLLHDVGKIMVSPDILNKTGGLDEEEWKEIHRHPDEGARIAEPLVNWLGDWSAAIAQHHEKWDGTGYPRGLSGDEISYGARIVAVADAYEVMTSSRSYREAIAPAAAREELARSAGSHFDPRVVRAFLNISIGRLRWAMGPLSWIAQLPFLHALPQAGGPLPAAASAAAGGAAALATGAALGLLPGAHAPAAAAPEPAAVVAAAPLAAYHVPAAPSPGLPQPSAAAPTTAPSPPLSGGPAPTQPPPTSPPPTRPNGLPTARDDSAEATKNKPVVIDVLANDSDPDGQLVPSSLTVVEPPSAGNANVQGNGTIHFVPLGNTPPGVITFRYRICDDRGGCAEATVSVTLTK